jgi:hypothetical protein
MNEDDTFNKLKKSDWATVHNLFCNLPHHNFLHLSNAEILDEVNNLLIRHGWTFTEFKIKWDKTL